MNNNILKKNDLSSQEESTHEIQDVLDQLDFYTYKIALFLDIDGTLADFKIDPLSCFISKKILKSIQDIQGKGCLVSVITGRDYNSAQKLLADVSLPIAALHGLDIHINEKTQLNAINQNNQIFIQNVLCHLEEETKCQPDLSIENKHHSIALHYRKNPDLHDIAKHIMNTVKKDNDEFKVIEGKYVFELIPKNSNKGSAIKTLLSYFDAEHYLSIFIGDDITDEDGFNMVNQLEGISIKVGSGKTVARFRLKNIEHVEEFLNLLSHHFPDSSTQITKKYGEQHV
ncbi:trehalose 6-phosphate phosphatase [Acinetobacter baylyi]|uniref:Trehalose 6-phosphate phosphatase n=1 Tax=Acinetobacter baylyi TaxID=202950 RepID=A0ABU0USK5_ACIBI|nr:trehalose-phosphatase [Acinetobacter baylyi]MDQ1207522.1 trehalose 6-phosphate phosphatase [Acinetobacter baylyi]MDR6105400.1 trehalose 6-phosphate phosphatase [Acinetobacter baylyi]MDR6184390.1 trehalose 6-phosphate phosphatase [Acinetobacter baylyi]